MGSFSDYLENEILDHVFGGTDYPRPATLYIALYTANPTDAGGGTEVGTGTWTNYARVAVTNNATQWPAASGGSKSNANAITWPTPTTSGNVTVVGFGIFDASSGGNLLAWDDLASSVIVQNGQPTYIAAGGIVITQD